MTMQGWELQDIHLRRGQTPVFAGLHLQLHEARIGLIGFNGAGKTSLLRMLAGLDVPQQGRIVRQGETLHSAERGHAPSRRVGLMFQNPDDQIIFPTVQEELQLSWRSAHPRQQPGAGGPGGGGFFTAARPGALGRAGRGQLRAKASANGCAGWPCGWPSPRCCCWTSPDASLDLPGQLRLAADMPPARSRCWSRPTCWTMCATTRACCGWSRGSCAWTGRASRCAPRTRRMCAAWASTRDGRSMGSLYSEYRTWLHGFGQDSSYLAWWLRG